MRRRSRAALGRALFGLLVAALVLYTVFPFAWAILSSIKPGDQLGGPLLPSSVTFDNYAAVFREAPFARNILNSVIVSGAVVALSLILALPAAYALGRVRFRGRGFLLAGILSVSMFPQVAVLSGLFELIRTLGLYNTLAGLVLATMILTLPFTVWVMTGFLRAMPRELEEAAMLDGATPFVVLTRVYLPLLMPALATTGVLAFMIAWNEFLFALTFTLTDEQRTVPVAIALISGASRFELPWGRIMAASVIVTLPLVALVLVLQRRIVAGLMAGALKG
ncbi:carbohydrate ABC transporter permease [Elioraea rosea]|uniref:carbohydrate ABC transporter permease n=1 Tax=Elioraea rosea TaxID=2492390 RepID=UPI00118295D2|nr:carbohydrate ABC transporter permease [Elioraea rosea]